MLSIPRRPTLVFGVTCLFLLINFTLVFAQRGGSPTSPPSKEGGGITIPIIKFDPTDGTEDYLNRGAGLTGIKDGKTGTISFWYRPVATKADQWILTSSDDRFTIRHSLNTRFILSLRNSIGAYIFLAESSVLTPGQLIHVFISWDLANFKGNLYINGVDERYALNFFNKEIEYDVSNWQVGNRVLVPKPFEGELGQLWFSAEYVDPTIDISKFYNNGPVDSGKDGSATTGIIPLIYLNNSLATWHNNLGSGGHFVKLGALTAGQD
jgi:hypothetical protein